MMVEVLWPKKKRHGSDDDRKSWHLHFDRISSPYYFPYLKTWTAYYDTRIGALYAAWRARPLDGFSGRITLARSDEDHHHPADGVEIARGYIESMRALRAKDA